MNLKGRSFLTLKDFTPQEIEGLLELSAQLKDEKKRGITGNRLKGKNIALLFEKASTRTRCSFAVACNDEGAYHEYLGKDEIHLGKKESVEDTARVLGRFFDGIEFRGFSHRNIEKLAEYSGVPVWNGLTDECHPIQVLADFFTLKEYFGHLDGLHLAFVGDGRDNVSNSLLVGCGKMGIHLTVISPKEYWPREDVVELACQYGKAAGSTIRVTDDVKAVEGADCIYTDVWCSMGQEKEMAQRIAILTPYRVTAEMMQATGKSDTVFMHCLPAVKGNEVTEEVFESDKSIVFDEAENRMHTAKAVMVATLAD